MNYQTELEKIITRQIGIREKKTLLIHSCCAPCSSYVLEYLREYFKITVFYYNPNITEQEEYRKRVQEQKDLIEVLNQEVGEEKHIQFLEGTYEPQKFFESVKGLEQCLEGGERCQRCFWLRLRETAVLAQQEAFDYFVTTLTISPLKNAEVINQIGKELEEEYDVKFLPSDFKKKNGYLRSVELSAKYHLYRQDYCGCIYSKAQREKQIERKEEVCYG